MKALVLFIGLFAPLSPDAMDEWQRIGSESLENTRWMNEHKLGYADRIMELRKIWYLQAIGDLETYSRKARAWQARYPETTQ